MRLGALFVASAAVVALVAAPVSALAAKDKKAAAKPVKVKKASHSKKRPAAAAVNAAAVTAAPEPAPLEALSDVQIVLATMVQVGQADCEFQQTVMIEPDLRQLGGFVVRFQKAAYTMVPEQTTTGAIRLVDQKAGVAWLQIRYKSMLMNTRAGQRMVDACSMPAQRLAEAEAERLVRAAAENPDPAAAADTATKEQPLLRN